MKKPIVIGSIVAVVCIGVGAYAVLSAAKPAAQVAKETPVVTVTPKALLQWDDPAGFSFKYPSDLKVDKHDEDTKNYAHVELTSSGHTGNIIIWAKDTTYPTVAGWIKADASVSAAPSVDTTLGGKEAKKIMLTGTAKKLITGAIDEEVLVTVEADMQSDEAYWTEVYTGITQSFAFTASDAPVGAAAQPATEESSQADEEEVLE